MRTLLAICALTVGLLAGCAIPREELPLEQPVAVAPVDPAQLMELPEETPGPDLAAVLLRAKPAEISPDEMADKRTGELVAYLAGVARAGAPVQKKELASSVAAFGRSPTPYARLKLGGLYAQPVGGLRDDARALALLEPLATTTALALPERPIADLAALLYAQVAERQRIAKDDAKKQDELRERIEAMKSIERSILQREERQRTR
jgi:hypothetical protein